MIICTIYTATLSVPLLGLPHPTAVHLFTVISNCSYSDRYNFITAPFVGLTTVTAAPEPTVLNSADFIFLPVKLLVN